MYRILFILLLSSQTTLGQKLDINVIDSATGKMVKETSWIKIKSTNRSVLKVKLKRVGEDVRFYHTFCSGDRGVCDKDTIRFVILFSDGESVKLLTPMSHTSFGVGVERNVKYVPKPTDEPEGFATAMLSDADLTVLANKSIERISICLFGMKCEMTIREKDKDILKKYALLVK